MPQLSYSVSDLQQEVDIATVGDLIHANHVRNLAKKGLAEGHRLKLLHPHSTLYLNLALTHAHKTRNLVVDTSDKYLHLGMAAVHAASFMGQPDEASTQAYVILLSAPCIRDG